MAVIWNPWHGCQKYSAGCAHCYVYRRDESIGKDASLVEKTASFDLPLQKKKDGSFRLPLGETVFACMTSDFFLEEADAWRPEVWRMIQKRPDVSFSIITKRIVRMAGCLPSDWGEGYEHVRIGCTVENQEEADRRLPVFLSLPIRRRFIICEPLLGPIDLSPYLSSAIEQVVVGGESGPHARLCRYEWVLDLKRQCLEHQVSFHFKQTGARFEKDGKIYHIPRKEQQKQAQKSGLNKKTL